MRCSCGHRFTYAKQLAAPKRPDRRSLIQRATYRFDARLSAQSRIPWSPASDGQKIAYRTPANRHPVLVKVTPRGLAKLSVFVERAARRAHKADMPLNLARKEISAPGVDQNRALSGRMRRAAIAARSHRARAFCLRALIGGVRARTPQNYPA